MIFCRDCGHQMHESAQACPSCGSVSSTAKAEPSATPGGWFSFQGRIGRQTYWLQYILPLSLGVGIFSAILENSNLQAVSIMLNLVGFAASLAGSSKRCHDRNRSAFFQLWLLLPIIGWIWVLVELYFLRGTIGANRYGPDPLQARTEGVRYSAA